MGAVWRRDHERAAITERELDARDRRPTATGVVHLDRVHRLREALIPCLLEVPRGRFVGKRYDRTEAAETSPELHPNAAPRGREAVRLPSKREQREYEAHERESERWPARSRNVYDDGRPRCQHRKSSVRATPDAAIFDGRHDRQRRRPSGTVLSGRRTGARARPRGRKQAACSATLAEGQLKVNSRSRIGTTERKSIPLNHARLPALPIPPEPDGNHF
jgi:hypothetical protein